MKKLKPYNPVEKRCQADLYNPRKLRALQEILNKLELEIPIPPENNQHMLTADYSGYMECHIQSDFLLIWFDPDTDEIDLVRLGSHSELYGKGSDRIIEIL